MRRLIGIVAVLSLSFGFIAPAIGSENRVIDVAQVTWPGASKSVNVSDVANSVTSNVSPRWRTYTSIEGSAEDRSINFVLGKTLEAPIILGRPMDCEGSSASGFMNSVRQEVYLRLGISASKDRYLIILTPSAGCIWSGRALIGAPDDRGGVMTLQDTASPLVIAHELGHTLGLGHSNFLRCTSGANDGPWGQDCLALEYGGTVDIMGNVDVDTPLSTYNQWRIGLLDKSEIIQSWVNEKITLTASDVFGGTRVIFLRDGQSTYWIEYRRANSKASYKPGLVIYRTDPPPISAISSPNPEDLVGSGFGLGPSADVWMLNWDNYSYAKSRASGSMTLPEGKTARVFSGRISIFANSTKNSNTVEVTISRAPDLIAPPTPAITDPLSWKSADDSIITAGYDDGESSIAKFEAEISGKIVELIGSQSQDFTPTYFNPFAPAKNVYLRDLPEGKYRLRLRSIDVWGNVSAWSKSVETYVDRGLPLVTSDFVATSIDQNSTSVIWRGARDQGIGLCDTLIYNDDGFINYRSLDSISPKLVLRTASTLKAKAQLFDCLGNGITGNIDLKVDFVSADKPRRTGKWTNLPLQNGVKALRCYGKCTVSASITGKAQALISQGSVSISIPGGKSETFANMTPQFKFSEAIDVGKRSRVIRITGSNFTFGGISRIEASLGDFKPILAIKSIVDPTLNDSTQADLSRFGFNSKDFTQDWTVLPMARGTSLLDPTLDLCSATYLSESGRQSRRQVAITKSSSRYQFLSSETVKYISEKAAQAALSELKRNLETCMINKGGVEGGLFVPYNFQDLPKFASKLVPEDKRIIVRAQIGSSGSERQLLAFYQFSGAYFSGLYVVLPGLSQFSDGEVLRWFDVAEVLAGRLVTGSGE